MSNVGPFSRSWTMDDPETGGRVWLKISSAKDWESNPNRRLSEVLSVTGMPKGTHIYIYYIYICITHTYIYIYYIYTTYIYIYITYIYILHTYI
jgi:hypothetical protein